ncbi:TR10B factor, partial [Mesembrinibis cayennensis]|nr:TR10B factor [Mesembrinibis cayennensis]
EKNGSSKCLPCKEDEYIEYPNDFSKCLGCRTCREDQVELSPCRAISDTQCACRNGTFCSPDHPCEMCQKCRPRCAKDEVELAPCTPHSDRQCGPPTDTFSGSSNNLIMIITVVVVVVAVVILLVVIFVWKRCCCRRSPGEHRVPGTPRALALAGGCVWVRAGWEEVPAWGKRGHTALFSSSRRWERPEQKVLQCGGESPGWQEGPRTSYPSVQPRRNLVPVEGKDPVSLLRRSFDIFARDVPPKDWKRFGRALDLLENDIALAEMNDKYSLEPFFQMLNMWQNREGMNASVNTLLETLHEIKLGGVAEDISSKLVQQGSFQYELI